MKKIIIILVASFSLAAVCVLSQGCSKSKDAGTKSGSSTTTGGTAELKVKWNVGKKYFFWMEMAQNSTMNVPHQPKPMKQTTTFNQQFSVSVLKELADGGRQLELEFISQKLESKMGDRTLFSFDSAQNAAPNATAVPELAILRKLVGARLRYLTDAGGKVTKIEGFEELMSRLAGSQPQMQSAFKQMFTEDTLKQYVSVGESLPGRAAKIGDTWTTKKEMASHIGAITVDLKYKLKGFEPHDGRQCARIEYEGKIFSTPGAVSERVTIEKGKRNMTGENWFDPELGMTVDGTSEQDMNMTIKTRTGQTIANQLNQKVTFRLVEVEDEGK